MSSVIFNFEYVCTRINAAMIQLSVIFVSIFQKIVRKKTSIFCVLVKEAKFWKLTHVSKQDRALARQIYILGITLTCFKLFASSRALSPYLFHAVMPKS